jgi:hypothetical protein
MCAHSCIHAVDDVWLHVCTGMHMYLIIDILRANMCCAGITLLATVSASQQGCAAARQLPASNVTASAVA